MGALYIFENCDNNCLTSNITIERKELILRRPQPEKYGTCVENCSSRCHWQRNLSCIGSGFPFGLYTLYHTRARGTDFTEYTWGIDYTLYTWGIYYWRLVSLGGASAYPPLASDPVEFKTRWEPEISCRERQLIPFPAAIWPMRNGDWGLIDQ